MTPWDLMALARRYIVDEFQISVELRCHWMAGPDGGQYVETGTLRVMEGGFLHTVTRIEATAREHAPVIPILASLLDQHRWPDRVRRRS